MITKGSHKHQEGTHFPLKPKDSKNQHIIESISYMQKKEKPEKQTEFGYSIKNAIMSRKRWYQLEGEWMVSLKHRNGRAGTYDWYDVRT